MSAANGLGRAFSVAGLLQLYVSISEQYDILYQITYCMHLHCNCLTCHYGTLSSHATLAITSDVCAGYIGDWVVVGGHTGTAGLVNTLLVSFIYQGSMGSHI